MIKKIDINLRRTGGISLTHDSRQDVRVLSEVCNCLINKVNELIDTVNRIEKQEG